MMESHGEARALKVGKAIGLVVATVLLAAFAACSRPAVKTSTLSLATEPPTVQSPHAQRPPLVVTPVAARNLPAHVRAVVGAMVARMRGTKPTEIDQLFQMRGSERIDADRALSENGFRRTGLVLTALEPLGGSSARYAMEGYLYFADHVDRRAAAAFSARYQVSDDAVILERADWVRAYPPTPRVEMFVVPADVVDGAGAAPAKSYEAFYALAADNAVPMRSASSAADDALPYVIVVFFRDRVPPGAQVAVRISDEREGTGGHGGATRYAVYDGGWPVATIPGRFALNEADAFWVKAVLAAGDGAREGNSERVVGLFSTAPGS